MFYDKLQELVNTYNYIDILLGDFSIDYFSSRDILNEVLSDYTMVVSEATHVDGSLLDHVYIKTNLLSTYRAQSLVKCVLFSDHDVVKVKMFKK